MPSGLLKSELLKKLWASQRPITARQLERWWKADAMDKPVRKHLPGIKGSVSVFPARAYEQAAALFDASRQPAKTRGGEGVAVGDRRLDERLFLLWWSGKTVVQNPRPLLVTISAPLFTTTERVRAEERTIPVGTLESIDEDAAFDIADAYVEKHKSERPRSSLFAWLRQNLGRKDDDLISVLTALLTVALGGVPVMGISSAATEEASLPSLVFKAFGFGATMDDERANKGLDDLLKPASLLYNREQFEAFINDLSDDEISKALVYSQVLFNDLPIIYESHEILFGRTLQVTPQKKMLNALIKGPLHLKSGIIFCFAWFVRQYGSEKIDSFVRNIEEVKPRAIAISTLAKAFPEFRKLFLVRNAKRLAALPEDTRKKMFESVQHFIT